jgi:hypothetical protein
MTMKKFKNYSVIAVGILALLVAIVLINASHARAQQAQPAKVVGPPPKPPQQVQVVNIPLPVFDIDNARQPFQASVRLNLDNSFKDLEPIFTVPNDKRLVIEYISARGLLTGNDSFCFFNRGEVRTQVANGGVQSHYFGMNRQGTQGTDAGVDSIFAFSQQARLYADPGTTVRAEAEQVTFCKGTLDVTISGYLVDVAQFQEIP